MTYTAPDADPRTLAALLAIDWSEPEPVGESMAWAKAQREHAAAIEAAEAEKERRARAARANKRKAG